MPDPNQTTEPRFTVTGPYRYAFDLHSSFRIDGPDGSVARVFAFDGNEDAAYRRAVLMAGALERAVTNPSNSPPLP